ncbi:MAG: class I SAM-dependent rRNA methyltransferase [Acidithiobacillus sp.]|nr:class I SAM-dependent rRNA methyltransferase [Acidithiobacillus sp.]
MTSYPILRLRRNEDRRLRAGHLWIYSNEVDIEKTPLRGLEAGTVVQVEDVAGHFLGLAHVSPHSLLCGRILSRDPEEAIDQAYYRRRLAAAQKLRQRLLPTPYYRLIHGEGDGLPGLVVDRHGAYLVIQVGSQGMERDLPLIVAALVAEFRPHGILLKASGPQRALEGLPDRLETLHGNVPAELEIVENDCRFEIDPFGGQKTGWFYDHRANRRMLQAFAKDRRVLDLFSYIGGFSLPLAHAGAREVLAVDSSAPALERLERNAKRNSLTRIRTHQGDVLEALRRLRDQGERFDLIVLDPPALIKARKDLREGSKAYGRLNDFALRLLHPGGLLFTASCSFHMSRELLLREIARVAQRGAYQILGEASQDMDHPVAPAIPENRYLKGFLLHRQVHSDELDESCHQ